MRVINTGVINKNTLNDTDDILNEININNENKITIED